MYATDHIATLLSGIPDGKIMDQLPELIDEFAAFLAPLRDKSTFQMAAMSRKGYELKGVKTFISKISALAEDLRGEVTQTCEDMLKYLNYGLYDGETDSFLDTSDLLEGSIALPPKIYIRYHKYPPKKE